MCRSNGAYTIFFIIALQSVFAPEYQHAKKIINGAVPVRVKTWAALPAGIHCPPPVRQRRHGCNIEYPHQVWRYCACCAAPRQRRRQVVTRTGRAPLPVALGEKLLAMSPRPARWCARELLLIHCPRSPMPRVFHRVHAAPAAVFAGQKPADFGRACSCRRRSFLLPPTRNMPCEVAKFHKISHAPPPPSPIYGAPTRSKIRGDIAHPAMHTDTFHPCLVYIEWQPGWSAHAVSGDEDNRHAVSRGRQQFFFQCSTSVTFKSPA